MKDPQLTFPPEVADFVRDQYGRAKVILEYGSGGSTVLAARLNKRVFCVESDPDWAAMVRGYLVSEGLHRDVTLHHVDIGPTKRWGKPKRYSRLSSLKYLRYSRSIWAEAGFREPDVILIDGRFRVGCFLACLARVKKPTLILFDDYFDRDWYARVEEYQEPTEKVGRMAVFQVDESNLPWTRLPQRLRDSLAML